MKTALTERAIINWLHLCCFMVFAMALIGAVTRLTESGLSITEWKPVTGALPPLSDADWQRAYDLYRQSPEFAQKHSWMEIGDFKKIYFWEWLHRFWGRLIGIVYALPLAWFALKKQIPAGYGPKLLFILFLGALQGAAGWWMVTSGLVNRPAVSHIRLAVHLDLALLIFGFMWWTALDLKTPAPLTSPLPQVGGGKEGGGLLAWLALSFLALTITWGAFTAGLDAGKIYNTFPLMNGRFAPDAPFAPVTEHGWVQFTHRWLAITAAALLLVLAARRKDRALGAMVAVQLALGISTLLTGASLPLAVLHQAGAIILLALTLRALHGFRGGKRREASA